MTKLFNDLRAAVVNTDPCDDAAMRELDYAPADDETDDDDEAIADAGETAGSKAVQS